jgi:hypothetical protein
MARTLCALCGSIVTSKSDSREHIIPASIGGRKRVKGFICKACNEKAGEEWDAELAKQLNFFGVFIGITRQGGKKLPDQIVQTVSGKKFLKRADGSITIPKPIYQQVDEGGRVNISVQARTMKEARELANLARSRYPNFDVDQALSSASEQFSYLDEQLKIQFDFGGPKSGRTIVKSALAWAFSCGIDPRDCGPAQRYLTDNDSTPCFGYYYEKDLIMNRPPEVLHVVAVSGSSDTRQLLGYVEFFGVYRIVVCLSDEYEGDNFTKTLSVDPVSGRHFDLEIDLSLSRRDVMDAFEYKKVPEGAVENAASAVMIAGMNHEFAREKDRVIKRAIKKGWDACGAKTGELLTAEHMRVLSHIAASEMAPFFLRFASFQNADDLGRTN